MDYFEFQPKIKKIIDDVYNDELCVNKECFQVDKYDPYSIHIIAEKAGQAIGYMRVVIPNTNGLPALDLIKPTREINPDTSLEFSRLMVQSDHRKNKKIALKLMKKGFDYAFKNGYSNIIIDVFLKSKFNMFKMFKQLGFREFSEIYRDYRYNNSPESIVMHINIIEAIREIDDSPKYQLIKKYFFSGQESFNIAPPGETDRLKEIKCR